MAKLQSQKYRTCIDACNECLEACEICAVKCLHDEGTNEYILRCRLIEITTLELKNNKNAVWWSIGIAHSNISSQTEFSGNKRERKNWIIIN
jgi:Synapsin, ATP binding domain/Domain of Unknown Function (DUF326)